MSGTSFSQKNSTCLRHPYRSFYNLTYSTICPFSIVAKFRYMLGSVFTISSDSLPHSNMMTSLYMSTVSNAPYVSNTHISIISCVSISDEIRTNYRATVGDVASFFCDPSRCFRPSLHVHPLIGPFRFYLKNINNYSASSVCWSLMSDSFIGEKVIFLCSCFSYFYTSTSPTCLNLLIPFLG